MDQKVDPINHNQCPLCSIPDKLILELDLRRMTYSEELIATGILSNRTFLLLTNFGVNQAIPSNMNHTHLCQFILSHLNIAERLDSQLLDFKKARAHIRCSGLQQNCHCTQVLAMESSCQSIVMMNGSVPYIAMK